MSDKKRSATSSTLKMKKLKKINNLADDFCEEVCDEACETTTKTTNIMPLTKPIFKKKLRKKLHTLLANWKPSLKTFPCENQDVILQTKSQNLNQIDEKPLESVSEITSQDSLQQISCENSGNMYFQNEAGEVETDDSNCLKVINNASENTNENITKACDVIVINEAPVHNTSDINTICASESNGKDSENCTVELDGTGIESNSKSLEQEKVEISAHCPKTCNLFLPNTAPELSQTSENAKYDGLTSDRTETIQNTKDSEQNVIYKQESEVSNNLNRLDNQMKFIKDDEEIMNSSHIIAGNQCNINNNNNNSEIEEKKEIEAGIEHTTTKVVTFASALEDDLNISHSQLDSIENNIMPTGKQTHISNTNHSQFIPFSSISFSPTIPQMNWVRQVQEDRRRLQAVVREISQLNALLTRAIREIWPVKKPS